MVVSSSVERARSLRSSSAIDGGKMSARTVSGYWRLMAVPPCTSMSKTTSAFLPFASSITDRGVP